jgi:5-methylcytosine-specific restriction endonuclease McrA
MAATTQVAPSEPASGARLAPLSPGRFAFQMTIGQSAHDKLVRLKALMSHDVPAGDLERIVERAFEIAIGYLERRKYGVTDRPGQGPPRSTDTRYIPAAVRRAVRERDGERCTYRSADGRHCEATTLLEFDHIVPFARGGRSTASNLTLRCRTHNQFEADRVYGAGFMETRRNRGRQADALPP